MAYKSNFKNNKIIIYISFKDMDKMIFNKEQLTALYDAEIHFKSATTQGIVKNCPRWLVDKVADIYEDATGSKVNRNWGCSVCVFNFLCLVGKIYFKDLQTQGENNIVSNESEPPQTEATETKKSGRKSKNSHN